METFETGYCVHQDHGVVSFIKNGRVMKLASNGRFVIFRPEDKTKLRPIARTRDLELGIAEMKAALNSKTRNLIEWRNVKPGSNFVVLCRVVAEMTRCVRVLTEDQSKKLRELKKCVDFELSLLYNKEGRPF
jgi:hypothetical protein